jgi:redox-sensitive bicupin YhaK (pirin superfamily)
MSNLLPTETALQLQCQSETPTLESYTAREANVGGLNVYRALPNRKRRLVGPWCFLDHYGPLSFESGKPMDVAPHPHIGLQTVTWLFSGEALHKDSLDNEQLILPGQLNLMTAGKGISHSEETPVRHSSKLHGLQFWVALPDSHRNNEPAFHHYSNLPEIDFYGARAVVLMGTLGKTKSPAASFSELLGAEFSTKQKVEAEVPINSDFEHAIFPIEGTVTLEKQILQPDALYYVGSGRESLSFQMAAETKVLLLGGAPFGEKILMWWNFVARTQEEIARARNEWEEGTDFGTVKRYAGRRIAAPPLLARPKS